MKELRRRQDSPSGVHEQQAMGPAAALSAGDVVSGNDIVPYAEPRAALAASLPSDAEPSGLAQPTVPPPSQNRPTPAQPTLPPTRSTLLPPCSRSGATPPTSAASPPLTMLPGAKARLPPEAERQPEQLRHSSRSAVQEVIQAVSQVMQERRGSGKAVDSAVLGTQVASGSKGQARTPCRSTTAGNEQQTGKSVSGAGRHHNAAQQGDTLWLPPSLGNGEPQQDEDGGIWDVPQVRPVGLHYI